jgi:hypothetical protein
MASSTPSSPEFLEKIVAFSDGTSYTLLHPLTEYETCHYGTPLEACIVYACRQTDDGNGEERVVKVKVQ